MMGKNPKVEYQYGYRKDLGVETAPLGTTKELAEAKKRLAEAEVLLKSVLPSLQFWGGESPTCYARQVETFLSTTTSLDYVLVDLTKFAYLKVRKDSMPPNASLVVCYEVGGVPVIADDLYADFVVVRREDLQYLYDDAELAWDMANMEARRLLDRIETALDQDQGEP